MIGRTVDSYRIVSRLGQGGMGEVFVAEDTALHRRVAVKFLPAHISGDTEATARFHREAQAAAALEHPNIVSVHHIGTFEGRPYIVMALVEGETLADLLTKGPVPAEKAANIAAQIASALSTAHRVGVVHRDIKPANVVITPDGRALVLDFGLAKLQDVTAITDADVTMGTAQYMAPEQIRGAGTDGRADIFSLGAVLYEMLSGRRPFQAEHREALFYAVLNRAPEPLETGGDPMRAELAAVAMRALDKAPERRFQNADEMLVALRAARQPGVAAGHVKRVPWIPVVIALIALVTVAMWWRTRDRTGTGDVTTESASAPGPLMTRQLTFAARLEEWPAWSPDGKQLAYVAEVDGFKQIFVRPLDADDNRQLTHEPLDHIQPAWSPDGRTLAFARANLKSGKLAPSEVLGIYYEGADVHLLNVSDGGNSGLISGAFNPAFSPDASQLAMDAEWAGPRRIWVTDARGHNPRQVTTDESETVAHVEPKWSPDGTRIVYRRVQTIRSDIELIDLQSQETIRLTDDAYLDTDPAWSPDGKRVYFSSYRGGGINIWRVSVSGTHVGIPEQITTGAGDDVQCALSPDGSRLAFSVLGLNSDLWRLPLDPVTGVPVGSPEVFIATTREDTRGVWSPDGHTVAFSSDRLGNMNLWLRSLDDGSERVLTTGPGGDYQANWSPDGRTIAFSSSRAGNADIWTVDLASGNLRQLTTSPALDINPFFSPDGKQIAFQSDRNGRSELFLMNADGENLHHISNVEASGHFMRWFPDGRRLLFASGNGSDRVIYTLHVDDGTLDRMPPISSGAHMSFSPDCSRVLEVSGHKTLWIYALDGSEPVKILEFDQPDIRVDYPVWSPDGHWAIFDRVAPQGGDIWILEGLR